MQGWIRALFINSLWWSLDKELMVAKRPAQPYCTQYSHRVLAILSVIGLSQTYTCNISVEQKNYQAVGSKTELMCSLVISIFLMPVSYGPWHTAWEKNTGWATEHLIQGPCHQWGCLQKDPSSHLKIWQLLTLVKKQKVRWSDHISRSSGFNSKDNFTEHSERKKQNEEVERQF